MAKAKWTAVLDMYPANGDIITTFSPKLNLRGSYLKGKKCKFSHDLGTERKTEKKSLYTDTRGDEEETKNGNQRMTTDKVCLPVHNLPGPYPDMSLQQILGALNRPTLQSRSGSMEIRNAQGRAISLLNDTEPTPSPSTPQTHNPSASNQSHIELWSPFDPRPNDGFYLPCVQNASELSRHRPPYHPGSGGAQLLPSNTAELRHYQASSRATRRVEPQSPKVPELERSYSYDSQANEPASPMTPRATHPDSGRQVAISTPEELWPRDFPTEFPMKFPMEFPASPAAALPDGSQPLHDVKLWAEKQAPPSAVIGELAPGGPKETSGKLRARYPCKYSKLYNCDMTFTTSGHASRHSKIHTAQRGVSCTWEGCAKKFTRTDNMKQHLQTHEKKGGKKEMKKETRHGEPPDANSQHVTRKRARSPSPDPAVDATVPPTANERQALERPSDNGLNMLAAAALQASQA